MSQAQLSTEQYEQAISMCLNGQTVQQGQQVILQNFASPGFCQSMMLIANKQEQNINIRTSAITYLKRSIEQCWNPKEETMIQSSDKTQILSSLIDAMIQVANERQIIRIYEAICYDLIVLNYPQQWGKLYETVNQKLLNSQNQAEIYVCLILINQGIKVHECQLDENRNILEQILTESYTGLQHISSIIAKNYNESTAEIAKLILKTYESAIYLGICPLLADSQQITNWMCFIKIILDSPMPLNLTQQTDNMTQQTQNKSNVFWKNKKWCICILYRFQQKYALPIIGQSKQYLFHIPEQYSNNFSISFLESIVAILYKCTDEYVSPQVIHYALKYLLFSLKFEKCFKALYPHLEKITYSICFPLCGHTMADEDLWVNNSDEYLRKDEDNGTSTHYNKNGAMEFILRVCDILDPNKQKYIYNIIQFIAQTLDQNADPRTQNPISIAYREGLYWILGKLNKKVEGDFNLFNGVEVILQNKILPEFKSSSGLLRGRACQLFGKYSQFEFKTQGLIQQAITGICQCLLDNEFPVKIRAAISLQGLVLQKEGHDIIKSNLERIFKIYIDLMEQSDNENIVQALEGIVKEFQEELSPFAFSLVKYLSETFVTYISKNADENEQNNINNPNEEEDNSGYQAGAVACLDAISNILDAPLQTSVYSQMEETLLGVIDFCLLDEHARYLEEAFGILNLLLYKQTTITADLWFYYPYIIYACLGKPQNFNLNHQYNSENQQMLMSRLGEKGYLEAHFNYIIPIIKNYIAKGKLNFLSTNDFFGNNFYQLMLSLINKTLTTFGNNFNEQGEKIDPDQQDMSILSTLYITIIEQNPGQVNAILENILNQAIQFLNNKDLDQNLRIANCEIIAISLYYNTEITIQYIQSKNQIEEVYNNWVQLLPNFKQDYDLGRALLGLASIFKLQQNQIPQQLYGIVQLLLKEMINLTSRILTARIETDSEFESDGDDDVENENDFIDTNDSKNAAGFHKTLSKLQQEREKIEKKGFTLDDDIDDDLSDQDYDLEEVIGQNFRYLSPFDKECEILLFFDILEQLKQRDQQMYNSVIQLISVEDQQMLSKNVAQAKQDYEEMMKNDSR